MNVLASFVWSAAAILVTCCAPVLAAEWTTASTSSAHSRSHCWFDGTRSCWATYTDTSVSYKGNFGTHEDAAAACSQVLDGGRCNYASGEPGPALMSGGWVVTCPGGVNQYGLCTSTLRRHATAYIYPLVIEQDVERPVDCPAAGRRFGNPIDGLTGEKHERLTLLRWSSQAAPLAVHYRSGRFARQVGVSTFSANNLPGRPGAAGSVGQGIPDSAGAQPFGPLWTHDLDSRITLVAGHAQLNRMVGGGGLTFRGKTDGSLMLPPPDQADRVKFMGGGGAIWLHRDPRTLRTHYFSAKGMPVHVVNADGTGRQWLRYSDATTSPSIAAGPDRLLAVRDAFGRQLRVSYMPGPGGLATDLVAGITDDRGDRTAFEYDTSRRLRLVRWPDGRTQRFTYDATLPWALAARIDETGVANGNWSWNAGSGLVTSTVKADGVDRHVLRFAQPPLVVVTDTLEGRVARRRYSWQPGTGAEVTGPTGAATALSPALRHGSLQLERRSQPAGFGCDASTNAMALDANGNATVKDDFAGARTCHAYDATRNLETVRVEGLDRTANCPALLADGATLPPGARKITTRWHPAWPIPEVVASPGRIETRIYNDRPDPFAGAAAASCMPWLGGGDVPVDIQPAALCRQVQRATTDSNGGQGLAAPLDPTVPPRDARWTYTAQGQPRSHDGPRTDVSDVTTWRYHDATTAEARAGDLAEVRNGLGQAIRFNQWSPTGLLLSFSEANGVTTALAYDKRQRLTGVTEAAGTPWARETRHIWDARGLLHGTDLPQIAAANAAGTGGSYQARQVRYAYDRAHRLVSIFNGNGHQESYRLDTAGHLLTRIIHHGDDLSRPPTVLQRDFDRLGRQWREWSVIQGVHRATELAHDAMGRLTSIRRPMVPAHGETWAPVEQRRYDALGQLVRLESNVLGAQLPVTLSRDASGALASVVSATGARFDFNSDGFGQVRRERSADSGETLRQYDAAGNLTSITDAQGLTTVHTYDALNRRIRTERRRSQESGGDEDVRYAWDNNPGAPLACSHGIGRLCRVDDATGSRHFAYDPFGNLVEQLTVELGLSHRQTFAWDAEGRLIATSDAGGASVLVQNGAGHTRVVRATVSGQPAMLVRRQAIGADGNAALRVLGNSVIETRRHDTSGGLASQADTGRTR